MTIVRARQSYNSYKRNVVDTPLDFSTEFPKSLYSHCNVSDAGFDLNILMAEVKSI